MPDVLEQIDAVANDALAELASVKDAAQYESWRIKFLGSNGKVKGLMKLLGQVPKDQKPVIGAKANTARQQIEAASESKKTELSSAGTTTSRDALDVTEPGQRPLVGNRHILMKTIDELTDLFGRMGFSIASGPEVEDEFHNFVALNIPEQHPARDPLDNFYLAAATGEGQTSGFNKAPPGHARLLRTQTSTVQIRVMETQ